MGNNTHPARSQLWIITAFGALALVILGAGFLTVIDREESSDAVATLASTNASDEPTDSDDHQILPGVSQINPPQALQEAEFVANNGETVSLGDFRGQYVLLAFGYTHCPDVCPANLLDFRQIKRSLGETADKVTFALITVDPERDTPAVLEQYVTRYDPQFLGLSGDIETLERIAPDFNLFWQQQDLGSQAGYLVDHTASRFLIDPQGRLVRIYSFTASIEAIYTDIAAQLAEQPA